MTPEPGFVVDGGRALRLALVGLPGSGKSTVGQELARRLGLEFVDSDHVIEQRIGCSIRAYFEREGEEAFRAIEQETISDLVGVPGRVLATGGGAILRAANRAALRAACEVVYLQVDPADVARRLRRDRQRPLLQVGDPLARLRALHAQRDPLYREVAHHMVATGRQRAPGVVEAIIACLQSAGLLPGRPASGADE